MPRFFTDRPAGDHIIVTGSDAAHISFSLRMKVGEKIIFCHGGVDYHTVIESFSGGEVICRVESKEPSRSEPSVRLFRNRTSLNT